MANPLQAMFQTVNENKHAIAAIMQEMDMHFDSLVGALPPDQQESFHCNMMQRRAYHLTVAEFAAKEKGSLDILNTIKSRLGQLAKEATEAKRSKWFKIGVRDAMAHLEDGRFKPKKKIFLAKDGM